MNDADQRVGCFVTPDILKLLVVVSLLIWAALFAASAAATLDFSALYTAGGLIVEGHRHRLFDLSTQVEYQRRVLGMPGPLPFYHLAYQALLFVPLALLPFRCALWIWRALSIGMLIFSAGELAHTYRAQRTHVFVLALALYPVAVTIVQGQDSILVLLLFSATLTCLTRGQEQRGGFLLALALFKPHLVLPIAVVLIWKRGNRFAQGFVGGSAAVFLISVAVTGMTGWSQMTELISHAASANGNQLGAHAEVMPNIRGILGAAPISVHSRLILVVSISAVLLLVVAWRIRNQRTPESMFPPLVALACLTSFHLNAHDLTILLIPVLALLAQKGKPRTICAGACFCLPMFWWCGQVTLFFFVICCVLILTLKPLDWEFAN